MSLFLVICKRGYGAGDIVLPKLIFVLIKRHYGILISTEYGNSEVLVYQNLTVLKGGAKLFGMEDIRLTIVRYIVTLRFLAKIDKIVR